MSDKERTIYATIERGMFGMYAMVVSDNPVPVYTGSINKAVREHIDLDKLIDEENTADKIELGKIVYESDENKNPIITVTNINNTIKEKYAN